MIAPFFINFNSADEITKLESRHWYLCNGESHDVNSISRTTPDLRGRFIWGGGTSSSTLPSMTKPDDTLDTSYTLWGSNTGHVGGEGYHELSEDEMPSHAHGIPWDRGGNQSLRAFIIGGPPWPENGDEMYYDSESRGGNKPHNNLPPYMVLAYFIYWPEPWDDEQPWELQ